MKTPKISFGKRFVEIFTGGSKVSDSNPLPGSDIDGSNREGHNTVFGDRVVGRRVPTLSSQFHYPLETGRSKFVGANGGSVNNNDSQLRLVTDAQANSLSTITGTFYLRYIPGHEAYAYFTAVLNTPTSADSYQRIGLFDGTDGFYIGYEGSDFVLARLRAGVKTTQVVDVSTVFPVAMGVFNPEMGNIYKISFGYLGFATVNFEVMTPLGSWVKLGSINYPNSSKETHIGTTFLPIRAELFNGSSAEAMEMSSGSVTTGIVDGSGVDPSARRFSFSSGLVPILAGNQTFVVFRNKTTYGGLENRINSMLTLISAATEGNKPVAWRIIENPTITTPGTWVDVNTADSIMEYNNTAVVDPLTGKDLVAWNMAKADSFFQQINSQKITLSPGETAAIQVNTSNPSEVLLSFRWEELF